MPYVKSHDRNQMFMTSLDMLVDPDSHARIIDAFIDSLDLKEMGFTHTAPSEVGRPAYAPGTMLKLYLYGHRNNIRSSRKLAKACHVNIEVKWLVRGVEPDFRSISDFRKDNHTKLKDVFFAFNKRFKDIMTGYLSVDGTKVRACNSKANNFTTSKADDRIKWLEAHIEEYLRQMDQNDTDEDTDIPGNLTAKELEAKLAEATARVERYKQYREYMERNNLSQISLIDPDSGLMKSQNGFAVCHNVQSAVDSETHMIADFSVTSSPTDYGQLESTLHEMKGSDPETIMEAVADTGYRSEADMARCLENGIIPHVILGDGKDTYDVCVPYEACEDLHPESTDPEEIKKCLRAGTVPDCYKDAVTSITVTEKSVEITENDEISVPVSPFRDEEEMREKAAEGYFVRDPIRNIVVCPTGEILRQSYVTKKDKIRYINKMACRHCPYKNQCTKAKKGFREVDFRKDEFIKPNGMWRKAEGKETTVKRRKVKREKRKVAVITLRPDRHKTATRMCLSEHPFGTIKRSLDSSYFLLRGNSKVTGEFALFSLAYNMIRAINLLGFDEVMKRMVEKPSCYFAFFQKLSLLWHKKFDDYVSCFC